jgi:hypothetical protein
VWAIAGEVFGTAALNNSATFPAFRFQRLRSATSLGNRPAPKIRAAQTEGGVTRRKVMDWFNQTTSIAGVQIPNWLIIVAAAVIVILLIYTT